MNQRDKGKRGERMARDWIKKWIDPECVRGVQYSGGADSSDVDSPVLKKNGIHIEVKFNKSMCSPRIRKIKNMCLVRSTRYDKQVVVCPESIIISQDYTNFYRNPSNIADPLTVNKLLADALDQAEADSGELAPVVMLKGNRTKWFFVVELKYESVLWTMARLAQQ